MANIAAMGSGKRVTTTMAAGLALACGVAVAADPPVRDAPAPEPAAGRDWRAFRVFDSRGTLPQNGVLAIGRDAAGFVVAGTPLGLARYDGLRWEAVPLDGAAVAPAVGALAGTDDGALWIGTDAGGAFRWSAQDALPRSLPGPLPPVVHHIAPAGAQDAWLGTSDGLWRCSPIGCNVVPETRSRVIRVVHVQPADAGLHLLLGVEGEGLRRLDIGADGATAWSPFQLRRSQGLPNDVVLAIAVWGGAHGRDLWIGTGRGFARYDGREVVRYTADTGLPAAMVFDFATSRADDGAPVLLAALRPGGVAEVRDDGRWRLIGIADGLPDASVQSLYREPGRGRLWFGTLNGGIAREEPGRWAALDERAGLPRRDVLGVGVLDAPGGGGLLWVGTGAGAVVWTGGRFEPLLAGAHARRLVYAAARTADGRLWTATERGLLASDEGAVAEFTVDNSALPAVWASSLALRRRADGSEEIWTGTSHGVARWRADTGLERVLDLPRVPPAAPVRRLLVERRAGADDRLWLGIGDALLVDDGNAWRDATDCLAGATVSDLAIEPGADGALWIATRDALLRRAADGRCARVEPEGAAPGWTHVAAAADGVFAFGSRGGWYLPGGDPVRARHHAVEDGLPARELALGHTLWIDRDGRVYAGTTAGLGVLSPTPPAVAAAPATLHLVEATHGDPPRPLAPGAVIDVADASVRFGARLLAFDREHRIGYRIQLAGMHASPREWFGDAGWFFPRLPPGRYTFRVWGRDADGVESGPVEHAFTVVAPAWQRPWALAAYASALLVLGVAAGRWRHRWLARRAADLSREVAERTAALAEANRRLSEAATTDPLTGLHNRRRVDAVLPLADARLLVLIDIDRFKRVNDIHGHAAGDAVLVAVARRLREVLRAEDAILRWGGEEFLLLCGAGNPAATLRRVLVAGAGVVALGEGRTVEVTASAGAIAVPAGTGSATIDAWIALADGALYCAKSDGRDRGVLLSWRGDVANPRTLDTRAETVLRAP